MSSMGANTIFASDVGSVSVSLELLHPLTQVFFPFSSMTILQDTVAIQSPDGGLCSCAGIPSPMHDKCLPSQKFRAVWHSAFFKSSPFFIEVRQYFVCSVSSVSTLEAAKTAKNCLYIQMPVQEVRILIQSGNKVSCSIILSHSMEPCNSVNLRRSWRKGTKQP